MNLSVWEKDRWKEKKKKRKREAEDYKSKKSLSDRARKTTKRVWGELAVVWRLSSAAGGIHDVRLERKHAISNS